MAMTNEEFQQIVLEKLSNLEVGQKNLEKGQKTLEVGQKNLEEGQKSLEERQKNLEERQKSLEIGQKEIRKNLEAVVEQTANLTEFKEEINNKVDTLVEDIRIIEIVTSKNWNDVAKLKSII